MKKALLVVGALLTVAIGCMIYRVYPRHVSVALKGIEYQAGSAQHQVKTVTLEINGTLHTSLLGKQTFDGTVNILGTTVPNRDNGKPLTIVFNADLTGGEIIYFNWKTKKFYDYGSMFTNHRFNQFTILEYQSDGSGWSSGNGVTISAPAQTRSQAVQISNDLMKNYLNGNLLK